MYNKPQGITLFYVVIIEKNGGLFKLLTLKRTITSKKVVIPTDVQNGYKGKIASLPTAL